MCHQINTRKGTVQIEFMLGLPLLITLISIFFGVCEFVKTRTAVSLQARNLAFADRNDYTKKPSETLELAQAKRVGKLLGNSPSRDANAGVLIGEANGKPTGLFGPMKALSLESSNKVTLFAGTWDHREIEFEPKSKHPALKLSQKVKVFMPELDTNIFKGLAGFGAPRGSMPSAPNIQQLVTRATRDYPGAIRTVQRRIAKNKHELESVRLALKGTLDAKTRADLQKKKRDLEDQIRKDEDDLKELQKGQALIRPGIDLSLGDANSGFREEMEDESSGSHLMDFIRNLKPSNASPRALRNFEAIENALRSNSALLQKIDGWIGRLGIADNVFSVLSAVVPRAMNGDYRGAIAAGAREVGKGIGGIAVSRAAGAAATTAAIALGMNPVSVVVASVAVTIGAVAGFDTVFDSLFPKPAKTPAGQKKSQSTKSASLSQPPKMSAR